MRGLNQRPNRVEPTPFRAGRVRPPRSHGDSGRIFSVVWLSVVFSIASGAAWTAQENAPAGLNTTTRTVSGIPSFEEKYRLRYHFESPPQVVLEPAVDLNRPESLYAFDVYSTETIRRGERESVLAFDFDSEQLLAARAEETQIGEAENIGNRGNPFDLLIFPYRISARDSKMGQGTRSWILDPTDGLTQVYRDGREIQTRFDDGFEGRESLLSSVGRPASARLQNGALTGQPTKSPLMERLHLVWADESLLTMLPPLPNAKVEVGQSWNAGMMIQASLFAEPSIVRCEVRLRSFDTETQLAEIGWKMETANASLMPVPGIHHIDKNSRARIRAAGVMLLHAPTGKIKSSDAVIRATIVNPNKTDVSVEFVRSMHLRSKRMSPKTQDAVDLNTPDAVPDRSAQVQNNVRPGGRP